jgi:5-methylcytosine-specific restriction endonuclease McrA
MGIFGSTMKICKICGKASSHYYNGHNSCKECVRDRQLKWYANNKQRNYANSRRCKLTNPEQTRALQRKHMLKPSAKERQRSHNLTRIARQKNAPGKFTAADIRLLMVQQNGQCKLCGVMIILKFHIDHIVPLVAGGSNWPFNLQLLCPTCNMKKGSRVALPISC